MTQISNLPRLLYVGDVPIEATVAGSMVLYRLLQRYPPDRLRIVESNLMPSSREKRLPRVSYDKLYIGPSRLLRTRFNSLLRVILYLAADLNVYRLTKILNDFQPEGILTVEGGFTWLTAASLAKHYQIPLHFIIHDDWPTCNYLPRNWRQAANKRFGQVYRQAQSRLCVSPYMAELYQERYGVAGEVLYPVRAADTPDYDRPPERNKEGQRPLTLAYCGSINSHASVQSLATLAEAMETVNGRLIIHSSLTQTVVEQFGLDRGNVSVQPLIPYQELPPMLRAKADALLVLMNFEAGRHQTMGINFPSKLTDYTVVGLPLLICGPPYSSAVRWARENPGVAEVVTENSLAALTKSVHKLSDSAYRHRLGSQALRTGREYFSYANVTQRFYRAIQ